MTDPESSAPTVEDLCAPPPGATRPPALPPVRPNRTQILLFLGTVLSTLLMYPLAQRLNPFTDPALLGEAAIFSATLLLILGVHEMGHFLLGRYYRVDVSLPYFIPAPNLLGTFGALIRIRSAIADRRALLMIGAAGPIAGFVVAVPATIWGVARSEVGPIETESGIVIGGSLLLGWIIEVLHGPLPAGSGLNLDAMAFAGWAGLFLTAFNLLPLGQLDGGHVLYALMGPRSRWVAVPVIALLVFMGLTLWMGWALVCFLVLAFGWRHPPVLDAERPLGMPQRLVALASLIILILCFAPVPILSV